LLLELRTRVIYGINRQLIDLVSLKGVGRVKARLLYNKGYMSLEDIKKASVADLAKIRGIGRVLSTRILEQLGVQVEQVSADNVEEEEDDQPVDKQSSLEQFMK